MALGSSEDTVAILYDNENAPFEMLDFALKKARRFMPCRMIVISDWDSCPDQKRWEKLRSRQGFTFRQVERTRAGENSLDYALADTAMMMCREGVARFVFITTDSDFADIARALRQLNPNVFLAGVGTAQANQTLRAAYDKFVCYNMNRNDKQDRKKENKDSKATKDVKDANNEDELKIHVPQPQAEIVLSKGIQGTKEKKEKKPANPRTARSRTEKTAKAGKTGTASRTPRKAPAANAQNSDEVKQEAKVETAVKAEPARQKRQPRRKSDDKAVKPADTTPVNSVQEISGDLTVHIPRTLHQQLVNRMTEENVDMNQLVTYILMQGINK